MGILGNMRFNGVRDCRVDGCNSELHAGLVGECGSITCEIVGIMVVGSTDALQIDVICVDRKSTRLNSSHSGESRMPSSA